MPTQTVRPSSAGGGASNSNKQALAHGSVVLATATDLSYVVHLQKLHGQAVGFLPRMALAEKIGLGQVWIARENGEPAGFLHHGSLRGPEVRIFQAAVEYDVRRRRLAAGLVENFLRRAAGAGARGVSLRCLSYLEANDFWSAMGFGRIAREPGAKGLLNVWTKDLCPPGASPMSYAGRVHSCPACGRATVDTWTRGGVRHRLCAHCCAARG